MASTQCQNCGRMIPERRLERMPAMPKIDTSHRHLKLLKNSVCMPSRSPEMALLERLKCGPLNAPSMALEARLKRRCKRHCKSQLQWCRNDGWDAPWMAPEWCLKRAWNDVPHRGLMALERRLNAYKEACKSALNDVFLTPKTTPERRLFRLPYYASQRPALL